MQMVKQKKRTNAWFVSSFCPELTLFCTAYKKNFTALNQSEWRKFFMYIITKETEVPGSWKVKPHDYKASTSNVSPSSEQTTFSL